MKIVVDKEMTVSQLGRAFNEVYPFLKIELYCKGNEVSNDSFNTLGEIANVKKPSIFIISPTMTIHEIETYFWEELGLQVAVFRKVGNSWIHTSFTNDWTLERQNRTGMNIFGAIA
ncbi:hypothetical protein [Emticicia sp. BO119]|uniref:hypothetical protein n=1 Tax=Emticicia sp. BO119 TaxID=2757768 RepID=UPI0015F0A75A|nr:hypothetical protein [Emticicia sp. BO119]MBA4848888.1 hypothetical protein [Emticicia sp. BO119]